MGRKLAFGVGINDADYPVLITEDGWTPARRITWRCPFHASWVGMLRRGYSEKFKDKYPTYKDVTVCTEWHTFSNFKSWMEKQDWEGKELDKDLLVPGNKIYSPETCCFIPGVTNRFITERRIEQGPWPIGVYFNVRDNKYQATVKVNNKTKFLGYFSCPSEAHKAWLSAKIELADKLAEQESDRRIAEALRNKYRTFRDPWFDDHPEYPNPYS